MINRTHSISLTSVIHVCIHQLVLRRVINLQACLCGPSLEHSNASFEVKNIINGLHNDPAYIVTYHDYLNSRNQSRNVAAIHYSWHDSSIATMQM